MENIAKIMGMIDWHMSPEIQSNGRELAKNFDNIKPFLQPLTPKYNKNVWENCALILAERSDEELKPYLVELLEWLQDMNWPGAFCVLDRVHKYADNNSFRIALNICIERAKRCHDETWEYNLNMLAR